MLLRGAFSAHNSIYEPDQQALSLCRHLNSNRKLIRHQNAAVLTSFSPLRGKVLAAATGRPSTPQQQSEMVSGYKSSLADRLRLGSLTDDRVYTEKFIVRSYEVGVNKTATIQTIASYMQEAASQHLQSSGLSTDGFATTDTMRKLNLIWVVARMHIQIFKYPAWRDVVEIQTWARAEGKIGARRDWIPRNCTNQETIGRATSMWVMMNQETRRLQKVIDEVRKECEQFCTLEPRLAFPEEYNSSLKKISKLKDPAHYSALGLVPKIVDLDMNQHVNNVAYVGWILESMPKEIIDTHELGSITLDYRRECKHDDFVHSLTSLELTEDASVDQESNGSAINRSTTTAKDGNCSKFLHLLRLSGDGLEISRGRTEWRKKPA